MTRERFHAVFLAAIMALSVVAIGAGFAGSAAADGHVVTVGSSSGDDYESIQNAIDKEGADSVIELNDTEYATDVSINSPNITLRGGDSTPVVDGEITVTADQVTISGVTVTNSETGYGIVATDVSGLTIENSTLRNIGTATDGSAQAIYFDNSSGTIHNNTISNVADSNPESSKGVFIGDSDEAIRGEIEITDNDISGVSVNQSDFDSGGAGAYGILVNGDLNDQLTIAGNTISDLSGLWVHGIGLEASTPGAEISANSIRDLNATKGDSSNTDAYRDEAAIFFEANPSAGTVSTSGNSFSNLAYGILPHPDDQNTPIGTISVIDGPIQTAVNHAAEGDTVELDSRVYDDGITVNTNNISIKGPNAGHAADSSERVAESIITGQIDISSPNVTVDGVQVSPDTEAFEAKPAAAIIVSESNATIQNSQVADFSVNITQIDVSSVQAIQVWKAGSKLTGTEISDNSVENISYKGSSKAPNGEWSEDYGNLYGIHIQGEIGDATVENNTLRDLTSDGYLLAAAVSGTDSDPRANPDNVVFIRNSFESLSAKGAPATAFKVSSDRVNSSHVTVSQNKFAAPVDISNGASEELDATFNYFADDNPIVTGLVTYDPFLTVSPDQVDADPLSETTDFGHDLIIPANGKPHSVAFPAPVEGNVSEVFGDFNGTVYAYDGDEWESGEEIADKDVDALDAFVVTVDEDERFLQVKFEYAETDDPIPSMTTTDLEAGWNFVGAPTGNTDSDEAFAGSTAEITTVIDVFAGQNTVSTPYGLDASGEVSNPSRVSPFKGYWVFVTDDGELGATVPVEPTQETEEGALTGN